MGRMLLLLLLFLLSISIASGTTSVAYATVNITVINPPPEIIDVSFSSEVLEGKTVGCEVEFFDNIPETVSLKKEWYVNDEFIFVGEEFSSFVEGDIVECMVTATDQYGSKSNQVGFAMKVQAKQGFFNTLMKFF
ncbi:MAG: hypothetical protein ABH828_04305 [archaeon]